MKTKILSAAMIAFAIGTLSVLPSCKKALEFESPSTSSPTTVFESTVYTNNALIGVYNRLVGDNGYGNRLATILNLSADDFKTSGSYSSSDRRGVSMYGASPDNTELANPFAQLYSGVERANICIKYIPLSNIYLNGSTSQKEEMGRYYGEALALRALFYHELIRNWGDVPGTFVPASDAATLNFSNSNRDETYDQLLKDLELAATLVPWRSLTSNDGSFRFTKGAVKGLRARIALARGGYSLRTESRRMERRADYLTYYKIAATECAEVIAAAGVHNLNPNYEDVFKTLHGQRLDDAHELMLEVAAYGANASTDSKLGYYNGLRYSAKSSFGQGGGGMNAIATYFYEFDPSMDCRRDVTIGVFEINDNSKKTLNTANTLTDGKFRKAWTAFNNSSTSQNFAVNWPILRFSDVLLMFAEADNEVNGAPSAAAQMALERVRKRAYKGFEALIPATPLDKQGFFEAIVKERLLEFGGEGIRKYDLIRWNLMETKFNETRNKLRAFMLGQGPYENVPLYIYVKENDYLRTNSVAEVANLDLYGGSPNTVFYSKGLGTSGAPAGGYVTKAWRFAVNDDPISGSISGTANGFVTYFKANERELLPYPRTVMIETPNLIQNNGY
ncbi:carbohydrate-binding protein SusD [Pedobacter sp. PACM 27299]|uniref:RagB/SusD family nutrient uptake outer membrane protein n=1 Tax=Pedobacter sp. PACM 27299 TaxID=1727164 RepID=UPI0007061D42|nr:RagB/SusD family nutrient uptake outer membrane protein [Pedobacter sp. PACM 27299]ALL06661.1 carbohydrate-binding protein SusD [Pedobacter sp. PACM 27299]